MLPKKIPQLLLILIWVIGSSFYFIVELWAKKIPRIYPGADVVGDYISKCSLTFSTAFLFWFLFQWLQGYYKRVSSAPKQRVVIDEIISGYNFVIESIMAGGHSRVWTINHYEETDWERIDAAIIKMGHGNERFVVEFLRTSLESTRQMLRALRDRTAPFQQEYSTELYLAFDRTIEHFERDLNRARADSIADLVLVIEQLGYGSYHLERIYRQEHRQKMYPLPKRSSASDRDRQSEAYWTSSSQALSSM